jgi:Beta-ketoacyl synthase, N-terminal domain
MNARNAGFEIGIEGIGLFAPGMPDWAASRALLLGQSEPSSEPAARAAPALLAANERRRAPESVLLALAVAEQACTMAGRDPRTLPNVFASSFGDLPINDYLCAELARTPLELSPTKFHNSVHNAPAGYWTIATGCMATSSALSAGPATFGAGLLEAALLAKTEAAPVLFAAFDVRASGPLADVIDSRTVFGVAFVLTPEAQAGQPQLRLSLGATAARELASQGAALQALHAGNPVAEQSLPVLSALAKALPAIIELKLSAQSHLKLEMSF